MPTFRQYLREFKSLSGALLAAAGVTTSLLPLFDSIAPPDSNFGYSGSTYGAVTALLLIAALILTYALWTVLSPGSPRPVMLATLVFGVLALVGTGIYFLNLTPRYIYIYEKEPAAAGRGSAIGEKVRVIVGDGDSSYTEEALKAIRENPGGRPSKTELINGFTLPRLDSLFREDYLRAAVQRLTAGYLCSNALFFLAFCCLVFGEAMKVPHRGTPRSVP